MKSENHIVVWCRQPIKSHWKRCASQGHETLNRWIIASAVVDSTIHWKLSSKGFGCTHPMNLTNRFHVATATWRQPRMPRMFLPNADVFSDLLLNRQKQHVISLFYMIKRQIIQHFICYNWKWVERILSSFDVTYCLYKMKHIHWLLYESTHSDQLLQRDHAAIKLKSSAAVINASVL